MTPFEAACAALAVRGSRRGPFGETIQARLTADAYLLALKFSAEMPINEAISAACARIQTVPPTTLERIFSDPHSQTTVRALARKIQEFNRRLEKGDDR